ncbi:hypothetical protein evm_000270 [Chilo suppressalis]|nr:hypothetical protein evm_000270 [Chilo suppressalis]
MSTDPDNNTPCPNATEIRDFLDSSPQIGEKNDGTSEKKKKQRSVSFPDDVQLVTQYFEPANPWQDVPATSKTQLAAEYLEACRRHGTAPIDSVLQQIRELSETAIGGVVRSPRLALSSCVLQGSAPADALEAVLRKVQFRRLEIDHAVMDDEGAEAIFDMIEYYESATVISITGERQFGIRGWQAASRMIKKSAELSELEILEGPLEASHAPVLARALRPLACRLRVLCLQRAALSGEPLLCLVIALKSNSSVRELRLGDNRLTASDACHIASLLRLNTRLQLLDLSNNMIQDAGAGHIFGALVEQAAQSPPVPDPASISGYEASGVAFLVLWNNQLTRNCAVHLNKALRCSQSLCVLNMGRNALGGECVRALCSGPGLISVGLQAARLTSESAPALRALLAAHPALQRIDLRDNRLGVAGLQAILAALKENTTLMQVDLDEPSESTNLSVVDSESATIARLTRDIRTICGHNEPSSSPERRVHRRISLTCHTDPPPESSMEEERRGRLRSPAPSPAGSPVPAPSRFQVTRVTPERESSSDSSSPSTPRNYCPASSRFKVVQVSEPPQIHVHPATTTNPIRKSSSRFSVTRNYDSVYNPVTPPPSPAPPIDQSPTTIETRTNENSKQTKTEEREPIKVESNNKVEIQTDKPVVSFNVQCAPVISVSESVTDKSNAKTNDNIVVKTSDTASLVSEVSVSHNETVVSGKVNPVKEIANPASEKKTETTEVAKTEKEDPGKLSDVTVFNFAIEDVTVDKDKNAMSQIEAITEDLGNLIQEFRDLNVKKVKSDCTQTEVVVNSKLDTFIVPVSVIRENVVLKKNKSESSLDSPDLEVSRLMNKKLSGSPFCDSSSSLEISGSSVESLNLIDSQQTKPLVISEPTDMELDRRKPDHVALSTESSLDSNTSEVTPVNSNLLNMSVSSNESVSPIIFGISKKIHDSLSSLEASVSSLDSCRHDKVMVTSADSGIEYSLQNPSESKENNSSNEGTLTNNSSLKESVKHSDSLQETITSPKRTASLLDVPALKTKGIGERMRKISWVAPSPSFHIPKPEPEKEIKLNTHLEKLLSLFQHPLFSRSSNEEEKKCNTPPRKDSSLTSSFWSWGSVTEKDREDKEDKDSSSEATDSTLSERVQVSFVDESFSRKLDSKTPSTDTDNTLSEFQTFQNSEASEASQDDKKYKVTEATDDYLVQKCLVLSDNACFNGNKDLPKTSDSTDLIKPNDLNKNYDLNAGDSNKNPDLDKERTEEVKPEPIRPRSFAAVLKSSGSENSLEKQSSPETGQPVDKLPNKVIRGIKENISPENTLTSSMTNTKTLALELTERQVKNQPIVNTVWEVTAPVLEKIEPKLEEVKVPSDLAPIATIEETCEDAESTLDFIDDPKFDEKNASADSGVTLEGCSNAKKYENVMHTLTSELEHVDLGKDALSYLAFENKDSEKASLKPPQGSLAQELQDAEIKEMLDLSPELIIDEAIEVPEVFTVKEVKGLRTSPVIPERAKIKKASSLEELSQELDDSPKTKTIAFKMPELSTTIPRDIPERRGRLRTRSGSSPKSLPESLNKPCPLTKMDSLLSKKKKKVSSLGKMAKDSLLALNMSEDEIAEFRRSYKLTSVESLRSLESVSEDANSQNSMDYRCRSCLRTSQESLMSLDSINEDCRCRDDCEKPGHSNC